MDLSIAELSEYWNSQSSGSMKRGWNGPTCLALVSYVLKFCSKPDGHGRLRQSITDLEFYASEYRSSRDDSRKEIREKELSETFANNFMPEAQKFFLVPKLQEVLFDEDKIPTSTELMAGFIHFLCQILNSASDQIGGVRRRYDPLQKQLMFLLAYLGDKPFHFQCTQLEDILVKFETLANEAGEFINSCIFARSIKAGKISLGVDDLLEKIKLLDADIKEHCIKYGKRPICATSESDVSDPLFIVDSLLDDLETLTNHRKDLIDDVMDQTRKLHNLLMSARSFLSDTNVPQDTKTEKLKECRILIRDLTYEAEYLINSFVVGNVPSWYLTLRLPNIIQKSELIETRFNDIENIVRNQVLKVVHQDSSPKVSSLTETVVVGFEEETTKILNDLTAGSRTLQLISICGMPGLGKTTLARKLYSNRSVTDRFDILVWTVVSQTYHRKNLFTYLLLTLSSKLEERKLLRMSDEELGEHIYKTLMGRRYLIVLDDVWSSNVWDDLRRFFPDNRNGSRVMFTSRNMDIFPSYISMNKLPLLSNDQCWELLQKKMSLDQEPLPLELEDIGKQIAEKCNGLPLAVVVVAGILANMKKTEVVWKEVKESLDTYMAADPQHYMNILELSYKHLPDHLKLCFLYLGAFPESTEIPTRKLVCLWIAEGFIQKQKEKNLEHVAEEYLMVLINRSLLIITKKKSTGGVKTCTIHDLVREMCLRRAHEENFMTTIKDHFSVYQKHNRLCIHSKPLAYTRPLGLHCRTFLGHLSDPQSSFSQMKLLRILDLPTSANAHYNTEVELKRIDQLFHLRYLAVDRMPETIAIGNLINLEFLRVDSIARIYVPSILLKVLKLRHLHLRSEAIFEKDYDTSQTNNLEAFSFVRIFDHKDEDILKCSPHLRKLKCICNETLFPDFIFLAELESLTMKFLRSFQGEYTGIIFPSTITKLALSGIGLSWEDLSSIVAVLPKLQVLKLDNNAFAGDEWETKEGDFMELKLLRLSSVDLEIWTTSSEHFPKLERLVLRHCEDLVWIPPEIGEIPTLQMIELYDCSNDANNSALQIEQEQREYGNDDLKVIIINSQ